MARPVLVMFVGIPGSGKTTFARQLAKELQGVILNSDAMRMDMWGSLDAIQATHADQEERKRANKLTFGGMNYATRQILSAGYSVIYDCNANHVWERQEKHDIAQETGALSVIVRITVPYELSLKRIQERDVAHDQRRISPERAVEVLDRFVNEIEEPSGEELVVMIEGNIPFGEQFESFKMQLIEHGYGD